MTATTGRHNEAMTATTGRHSKAMTATTGQGRVGTQVTG